MAIVFTGDLIGSTKADPAHVDATMLALSKAADICAQWSGSPSYFTRFRGDGWQATLQNERLALRATFLFFAAAKSKKTQLETRIGIGAGEVEIHSASLSDATGNALIHAGQALDSLKSRQRIATLHLQNPAPFLLAAIVATEWTSAQAEALFLALESIRTHAQIAEILDVHTNTVQEHLKLSHFSEIEEAIIAYEKQ